MVVNSSNKRPVTDQMLPLSHFALNVANGFWFLTLSCLVLDCHGNVFRRPSDNTWLDGDMSWPSIEALMLETDVTIEVSKLSGA